MKTYLIHLIRHAGTESGGVGRYIGQTDVDASEEGLSRVRGLMEGPGGYPEADAVLSSPLKRCVQTAKLIYPEKEPILFRGLIEYDFGEFEGKTARELKDDEAFKVWLSGRAPGIPVPFGESQLDFNRRICTCFERLVEGILRSQVRRTAVVTHGGVIMSLMTAYALPEAPMHEWLMENGCGYTLRLDSTLWRHGSKLEAVAVCPPRAAPPPTGSARLPFSG